MYSTLISLQGTLPDTLNGFVVVGAYPEGDALVSILHLSKDTEVPEGATILMSGDSPWTWMQFAGAYPALCEFVTPQEWAGENTAEGLDFALFPKLA